jgi:hypothetical protein
MAKAINVHRRLRLAGLLILVGIGLEAVSFLWNSPFAFFLFIFGTGLLVVVGILVFLYSLVAGGESAAPAESNAPRGSEEARAGS